MPPVGEQHDPKVNVVQPITLGMPMRSMLCTPEAMKESFMIYWECSGRLGGNGLPGLAPAQLCPILPSPGSQRPRHCFRGVGVFISSELR